MDSDAFMEGASMSYPLPMTMDKHRQVKSYGPLSIGFASYGMCAEFDDKPPAYTQTQSNGTITWPQLIGAAGSLFSK
ncbi:hypothetical protein ABTP79_18920, partial [Acinetobacter baumannii]